MEAELKSRLKNALISTALHLKERAIAEEQEIQATVAICDGILSVACDDHASYEDVMASLLRLQQRMRVHNTSLVASASQPDANLTGFNFRCTEFKRRCANPQSICRHFCKDHSEVVDTLLWEKLPTELVERICSTLPLSKILELVKLCKSWSRLPTATNFRQHCANAQRDLFGILMFHRDSSSYRLAVSDSKHEEWLHLELNDIPKEYRDLASAHEHMIYGHDGGLICILPHSFRLFESIGKSPSVFVINPLTGDKNYISVSSFAASLTTSAVLVQLIMDAETRCYKLILVIRRDGAFYTESYDSNSGLWSTVNSGFVYGDGVFDHQRYQIYIDCSTREYCTSSGKPKTRPWAVFPDNAYRYLRPYTFVRDHRFRVRYINVDTNEHYCKLSEWVWQNSWIPRSTTKLSMKKPPEGFKTRLLACQRYVLVVADNAFSAVFEHRHQHMVLYDRETCEQVCAIPQFLTKDFARDTTFMYRNLHFMCDLKWDAIP